MPAVEFTKLSSKGQVVIPREIRKEMRLRPGTPFAVVEQGGTILLKRIELPRVKSWAAVTKPFQEAAKKARFTREDLDSLIKDARRSA